MEKRDPPAYLPFEHSDLEDHADDKVIWLYLTICAAISAAVDAQDAEQWAGPSRRFMWLRNRLIRERDNLKPLVAKRLAALMEAE